MNIKISIKWLSVLALTFITTLGFSDSVRIWQEQGLDLGTHVAGHYDQFEVDASSPGAAVFRAKKNGQGKKDDDFTVSVVGGVILMHEDGHPESRVILTNFRFGGSVSSEGRGHFNPGGVVKNIRMGTLCIIPQEARFGRYSGTGVLRITFDD